MGHHFFGFVRVSFIFALLAILLLSMIFGYLFFRAWVCYTPARLILSRFFVPFLSSSVHSWAAHPRRGVARCTVGVRPIADYSLHVLNEL